MIYRKKFILIIICFIILILCAISPYNYGERVENLNVPIAVGYDLIDLNHKSKEYKVSLDIYSFESSQNPSSKIISSQAKSLADTRQDRQLKSTKKFLLGLEQLYILGDNQARYGLNPILDILINNPQVNDRGIMAVCNGSAYDLLNAKLNTNIPASESVVDLIKNSVQFNFFKSEFNIIDVIICSSTEGTNIILPYIDIKNGFAEITGLAVFNKNKMVNILDINDTRMLNLLRYNKTQGILTLEKDINHSISYYPNVKKSVKCYKKNNKLNFEIYLKLSGPIVSNELYTPLDYNINNLHSFERQMEKKVEKDCTSFINKMQHVYKMDTLNLGRIAASKFGRGKKNDWNKEICNANIKVKVKAKVTSEGRGDF